MQVWAPHLYLGSNVLNTTASTTTAKDDLKYDENSSAEVTTPFHLDTTVNSSLESMEHKFLSEELEDNGLEES